MWSMCLCGGVWKVSNSCTVQNGDANNLPSVVPVHTQMTRYVMIEYKVWWYFYYSELQLETFHKIWLLCDMSDMFNFLQALSMFSAALQSGQLGPVVQQFEVGAEAVDAANQGNMEEFVKALQKASINKDDESKQPGGGEKRKKREDSSKKDDDDEEEEDDDDDNDDDDDDDDCMSLD